MGVFNLLLLSSEKFTQNCCGLKIFQGNSQESHLAFKRR